MVSILFHCRYYVEANPARMEYGEGWRVYAQDRHCKESCRFLVVERFLVVGRAYDFAVEVIAAVLGRVYIAD